MNHKKLKLQLFGIFFKIGLFTFGGGFAMIPLIEREIVDKKAAKNVANFNNECVKELKGLWKNKLTTSSEEKAQMD